MNAQNNKELSILYQDEHYVVIHKPANMLMHRSPISRDTVFVLQTLRDQLGQRVYPIHRLDRATSGAVVFALSSEAAKRVVEQFEQKTTHKAYWAIARGWTDEQGEIDHPVADDEGNNVAQTAITRYRTLAKVELAIAVDRYPSSRYSLVEVTPITGRRQQIRKHFKHISHHLIGDTTHGNGKHNRFFRQQYNIHRLMLCSRELGFTQPYSQQRVICRAPLEAEWIKLLTAFAWDHLLTTQMPQFDGMR